MGGADTSPTSLIVHLWIYTAVPVTALNTKEFARRAGVVDTRLAWSRAEFELPLSPADAPSVELNSSFVRVRGRTVYVGVTPHSLLLMQT
jgi:hypothetical protein